MIDYKDVLAKIVAMKDIGCRDKLAVIKRRERWISLGGRFLLDIGKIDTTMFVGHLRGRKLPKRRVCE